MKRMLVARTALSITMAAPLAAQTVEVSPVPDFTYQATGQETATSDILGTRVFTIEGAVSDVMPGDREGWSDVGNVAEVLMGEDGQVHALLVDVGGFLGIGEKRVAVAMDALKFVPREDNPDRLAVVFTSNREALRNAPAYEDKATAKPEGLTPEQAAEPSEEHLEAHQTPPEAGVTGAETEEAAVAQPGMSEEMAGVDPVAKDANDPEGTASMDAAGDEMFTGDAEQETADGTAADAQDRMASDDDAGPQTAEEYFAISDRFEAPQVERKGFIPAEAASLTTETLGGAPVFDADDNRVGEISELITAGDGKIDHAVIDVGGFLGLGEKPVGMKLGALTILRDQGTDDVRVYVDATKERLKRAPHYDGYDA